MMGIMKKAGVQKMKKMKKTFKAGDFVRISDNTHQDDIPASRLGHIIGGEIHEVVHYTNRKPVATGVWEIFMVNGVKLKIHEMFLEHVE